MRNSKQGRANYSSQPFYTIVQDDRISCKARGLYFSIAFMFCGRKVSFADIKANIKEGKKNIYSMLSELEECGYIIKLQSNINGCFGQVFYEIKNPSRNNQQQSECSDSNLSTINIPIVEPVKEETEVVSVESVVEEKPKKPTKSLEERAKEFGNSLVEYLNNPYDKVMIRNFYDYWTEPNRSKTKMRFELEKTWCTSRRLKTWFNRSKDYGNNRNNSSAEARELDAISRQQGVENLVANLLSGNR